jgi:hypothetical protein
VINLEDAFRLFKPFDRAFRERPAHIQRDLIRDAVKRVTITGPCAARADYYTSPREEDLFSGASPIDFSDDQNEKAHPRSGVLTVFKLVDLNGFEPMTSSLQSWRSTN